MIEATTKDVQSRTWPQCQLTRHVMERSKSIIISLSNKLQDQKHQKRLLVLIEFENEGGSIET